MIKEAVEENLNEIGTHDMSATIDDGKIKLEQVYQILRTSEVDLDKYVREYRVTRNSPIGSDIYELHSAVQNARSELADAL